MAINYKICPYCNSKDVAKIVYGYPSGDMIMQEAAGKIKLGGCIITGIDPEYFCNNCEREKRPWCLTPTYQLIHPYPAPVDIWGVIAVAT